MPRSGKWTVRFLRVRTSIYIALLGLLVGLMVHQPARTVVWIVAGLLVAVFYVANLVKVRRYQQMLNRTQSVDGSSHSGSRNERQELQLWLLRRGARAFAGYAVVGAGIVAAGVSVSFSYSTDARPAIIGGSVFAGGWYALLGLTVSKRLRAGPIARLAAQADDAVSASGSDTDGPDAAAPDNIPFTPSS